jgi:hypothetical protein
MKMNIHIKSIGIIVGWFFLAILNGTVRGQVFGNSAVTGVTPGQNLAYRPSGMMESFNLYSAGSDRFERNWQMPSNPLSSSLHYSASLSNLPHGRPNAAAGLLNRITSESMGTRISSRLAPSMPPGYGDAGPARHPWRRPFFGASMNPSMTGYNFEDDEMAYFASRPNPFFVSMAKSTYSFQSPVSGIPETRPRMYSFQSDRSSSTLKGPLESPSVWSRPLAYSSALKDTKSLSSAGAFGSAASLFSVGSSLGPRSQTYRPQSVLSAAGGTVRGR